MSGTFDPTDYINSNPPPGETVADQFKNNIINLEDLPEDKKEEYRPYFESGESEPQAEDTDGDGNNQEEVVKLVLDSLKSEAQVELTEDMREGFIRSLLSNKPYSWTYNISDDAMAITFHTLTVKEYDAIADAVAKVSQDEGFINQGHLSFVNFRYTVSSAIESIKTTNEDNEVSIINYQSPLDEITATHREEVMEIKQLDGSVKTKTVTKEITNADKVLEAHESRFDNVNSTLYNLILNSYSLFEREVNALAEELYEKNFTAPIATSQT